MPGRAVTDPGVANRGVVVHGPHQAAAAARAIEARASETPLVLFSAENAAASAGPGWFMGVMDAAREAAPDMTIKGVLRCGRAPGLALAALRCGLKTIALDRETPAYDRVKAIAGKTGATLVDAADWELLDLGGADGAATESLVSDWFADDPHPVRRRR